MSPDDRFYPPRKHKLGKLFPSATQAYDIKVYKGERFNQESTTDMQVHKLQRDRDLPIH